jgi:2-methylisocitrate lyase-like PEP mutase family enzyme
MLRHERPDATAVLHLNERQPLQSVSWEELGSTVRVVATQLRKLGVKRGDRVCAYMVNVPEALVAMLATTSLGLANTLGSVTVSLDDIIQNCRAIADATDLPVNADLENGGADDPATAAKAIARAAEAGCVGGSIEDSTGNPQKPIYDFSLAVERVQAAVEAARALPFPFTLTARAENLLHGRNDLDDTIKRLQAFEAVGADVLYSPGVRDIDTIRTVVSSVGKPFNLVMGFADPTLTLPQLSAAGVKRISVGGAMERYALAAFLKCAHEMKDQGAFTYVREMVPMKEVRAAFQ